MLNPKKTKKHGVCRNLECKCKCKREKANSEKIDQSKRIKTITGNADEKKNKENSFQNTSFSITEANFAKDCMKEDLLKQDLIVPENLLNTNDMYLKQLELMEENFSQVFSMIKKDDPIDSNKEDNNNSNTSDYFESNLTSKKPDISNKTESETNISIISSSGAALENSESIISIPSNPPNQENEINTNEKNVEQLKEKELFIESNLDLSESKVIERNEMNDLKPDDSVKESNTVNNLDLNEHNKESTKIEGNEKLETILEPSLNNEILNKNTQIENKNDEQNPNNQINDLITDNSVKKTNTENLVDQNESKKNTFVIRRPKYNSSVNIDIKSENEQKNDQQKINEEAAMIKTFPIQDQNNVINNQPITTIPMSTEKLAPTMALNKSEKDLMPEVKIEDFDKSRDINKQTNSKFTEAIAEKSSDLERLKEKNNLKKYSKDFSDSVVLNKLFQFCNQIDNGGQKSPVVNNLDRADQEKESIEKIFKNFKPSEKLLIDLSRDFRLIIIPPAKLNDKQSTNYSLNIELNKILNDRDENKYRCEMNLSFKIS